MNTLKKIDLKIWLLKVYMIKKWYKYSSAGSIAIFNASTGFVA